MLWLGDGMYAYSLPRKSESFTAFEKEVKIYVTYNKSNTTFSPQKAICLLPPNSGTFLFVFIPLENYANA